MRSKNYVTWTPSKEARLKKEFWSGIEDADLAIMFKCSEDAIKGRRSELGLNIHERRKKTKEKEQKEAAKVAQVKQAAMNFQPVKPTIPTAVVKQPVMRSYKLVVSMKGSAQQVTSLAAVDLDEAVRDATNIIATSPDIVSIDITTSLKTIVRETPKFSIITHEAAN